MIIQNALKITENGKTTYLPSTHVHHYNQYNFSDGSWVVVDGGKDYFKRGQSGDLSDKDIEDYSLNDIDEFSEIAFKLLWGTRGKSGKDALKYLPFRGLEQSHLKAILDYADKLKPELSEIQKRVINFWIDKKS